MNSRIAAVSLIVTLAVTPVVFAHHTESQAQLQKEAKITEAEARKIALKRAPGTIESGELEREHGKLIYSFDIKVAGKSGITEVAVSAIDGKIVDVKHESAAKEAAEKKQEAKQH